MTRDTYMYIQKVGVLAVAVMLVCGMSYLNAAWTEAPQNPPGGNTGTPINATENDQVKNAALSLGEVLTNGTTYVQNGVSIATATLTPGLAVDVDGKISADEYCNESGQYCQRVNTPQAELIWQGDVGDATGLTLMSGKKFSDYDAIHYINTTGRELHGEVPYEMFVSADPNYWFINASFSGDDSGYNGIQYVDDTTFNTNGYRGGDLTELWGINY